MGTLVIGVLATSVTWSASADAPKPLLHDWREVGTNHWQIVSPPSEATDVTDAAEGTRGACSAGMVEVEGQDVRVTLDGRRAAEDACTKWINKDFPERCAEFDRDKWLAISKELPTKPMHFCIDRFEYPNKKGVYPVILVNWYEADDLCADEGKRLCTEDEWTFACEGEEATPYPYGYDRDTDACVIDQHVAAVQRPALRRATGRRRWPSSTGSGKACRRARSRSARAPSASTT